MEKGCDFCGAVEIVTTFRATDFMLPIGSGFNILSVGGWGACSVCAPLVKARDWEALIDRVFPVFEQRYGKRPEHSAHLRALLHEQYARLNEAMKGIN